MADLILKQWDRFGIRIREDRYVSLTDMADATGKKVNTWLRSKSTKSYLESFSSVTQICVTDLVQVTQSGISWQQGTWGHPKVAIRFAQWCNDAFAVQVDIWIDELLTTGKVELNPQHQKAPAKLINPNYLPDRKEAMDKLKEHGATSKVYGAVESYNNALVGIEKGCRHQVDELQAYKLGSNYGAVRRELTKRPIGFAKHTNHLANTAKQAMRYENYAISGSNSVPETLKPKKERKQLKAN